MTEINNLIIARDEMRDLYQKTVEANDVIIKKSTIILGAIGILFSLATLLNLDEKMIAGCSIYFWLILIISFLLFLSLILTTIIIVIPRTYNTPIEPNLDVLQNELLTNTYEIALRKIIRGYVEAIKINARINIKKAKVVKFGLIVFPIIVLLLISLVFIA